MVGLNLLSCLPLLILVSCIESRGPKYCCSNPDVSKIVLFIVHKDLTEKCLLAKYFSNSTS